MNSPVSKCVTSLVMMHTGKRIECYSGTRDLNCSYTASDCVFLNSDAPRLLVRVLKTCRSLRTDSLVICLRSRLELRDDLASRMDQISHLLNENGIVSLLVSQNAAAAVKNLPGYMQLLNSASLAVLLQHAGINSSLESIAAFRNAIESGEDAVRNEMQEARVEADKISRWLRTISPVC